MTFGCRHKLHPTSKAAPAQVSGRGVREPLSVWATATRRTAPRLSARRPASDRTDVVDAHESLCQRQKAAYCGGADDMAATTCIEACSRRSRDGFGGPGVEAAVVQSFALFSVGAYYFFLAQEGRPVDH